MKKYFIQLILLLSVTISCQNKMEEKFEWLPTESAPSLYPMNIYMGNLYFEDGGSVYIPCSGSAHNGWGNDGSTHTQGEDLKPVPVKLEVTWASYTENKFYTGSWDLPKEKMLKLFQEGVVNYDTKKKETYNQIIVGCAPGGVVVVWMYGAGNQFEIGRYQAHETHIAMSDYVPGNPTANQKEHFAALAKLSPDLEEIRKQKGGIEYGLWDDYRKKYTWRTHIEISNHTFENTSLHMFNGEMEDIFDEPLKKNEFKERAVPKYLSFMLKDIKGKRTVFSLDLDEEEIMGLFKQAEANKPIEIVLRMNENLSNKRLIFKQGEKETPIKKVDLENFWDYD